jgi:hypothetical protein
MLRRTRRWVLLVCLRSAEGDAVCVGAGPLRRRHDPSSVQSGARVGPCHALPSVAASVPDSWRSPVIKPTDRPDERPRASRASRCPGRSPWPRPGRPRSPMPRRRSDPGRQVLRDAVRVRRAREARIVREVVVGSVRVELYERDSRLERGALHGSSAHPRRPLPRDGRRWRKRCQSCCRNAERVHALHQLRPCPPGAFDVAVNVAVRTAPTSQVQDKRSHRKRACERNW